jgi:arabinose-5-phosphate isomerase
MLEILKKTNRIAELAREVFKIEAQSILSLKDRVEGNMEKAVEVIISCKGRVIVTGMGKWGHIGRKIAATLSSTGTPSYFFILQKVLTGILEL